MTPDDHRAVRMDAVAAEEQLVRTSGDTAPDRLLLGPSCAPVHPEVVAAAGSAVVDPRDPWSVRTAAEVAELLRAVLRTANPLTYAVAGTEAAAREAAVLNVVEPGDTVIVGDNGWHGARLAETVERAGATVVRVCEPWGRSIPPERVEEALAAHPHARAVALTHAESATGVLQPLEAIGRMLADHDTLLLVDAVAGLAGVPLEVDAWGCDVVYASAQRCLGSPCGLAPVTFSPRAEAVMDARRSPVVSAYVDAAPVRRDPYDAHGDGGSSHHAAATPAVLQLRVALRRALDEGLAARFARHDEVGETFQRHIGDRDATLLAEEGHRLPHLIPLAWPDGVEEAALRARLRDEHAIEVGAGVGAFAGRSWRVALMGDGATHANVDRLLDAVDELFEG